jgi:Herpesviridae UL52/UL70 DNA primase
MPLEAEWDPIACKVVYRHDSPDAKRNAPPPASENRPPNSTINDDWADVATSSDVRRRSRSQTRKSKPSGLDWREAAHAPPTRVKSTGIAPQSFHGAAVVNAAPEKPGQAYVRNVHAVAQQRNLEQQMAERRHEHTAQRHAFTQLTEYRTFPLQSRAIHRCRQLQVDWGLSSDQLYEESGITETDDGPALVAGDSSTSSASSSSSLEAPDRKRFVGETMSSQGRVVQYHNVFLEERKIPPKSVAAHQGHKSFGPALYCLEPRVFALETGKSTPLTSQHLSATTNATSKEEGRRRYVTAHVGRFLDKYWCRTEPVWRHAYEVIPPRTPCRLYLDLECTDPPELVGMGLETRALQDQVLDELFEELADELQERYASHLFECPRTKSSYKLQALQRSDVVDLDSSTDTKFSRHWIVHVPVKRATSLDESSEEESGLAEALFSDAAAVGVFVRQWIGRLAEQQATHQLQENHRPALQKYLFVPKKSKDGSNASVDQPCCLVDLGVYTRNRLFRLLGSTKFGKPVTAALRIADSNQFKFPDGFGNYSFYVPEMPTPQISEPDDTNASVDDIESRIQQSLSKTDWLPHAASLAETFVVPISVAKIDYPILPGTEVETRSLPPKFSRVIGPSTTASFGKSPYPMVDEFVQTHLASRGGTQGLIRAWTILRSSETNAPLVLSFQMIRNRWCECIGREHKSNNISWNCDLVLFHCYQTCYDPDCRALNFRGAPIPLPSSVQEELREALFEEALARLDISGSLLPQDFKAPLPLALEPCRVQDQTCPDIRPAETVRDDSSFESALAALNLVDYNSTTNGISTTKADLVVMKDHAGVHGSMKESIAATETVPLVELPVPNVLARDKNVSYCGSSDEESDIDLVALCREQEEARLLELLK